MPRENESPALCPRCGEPADRHSEMIPVERRIIAQEGGVLTIRGLISEKCYELPEAQALLCPNAHAFPIPDNLDVMYV